MIQRFEFFFQASFLFPSLTKCQNSCKVLVWTQKKSTESPFGITLYDQKVLFLSSLYESFLYAPSLTLLQWFLIFKIYPKFIFDNLPQHCFVCIILTFFFPSEVTLTIIMYSPKAQSLSLTSYIYIATSACSYSRIIQTSMYNAGVFMIPRPLPH